MIFSDYHFILYFLPACLGLYFLARRYAPARIATLALFLSSLVFYGWFKPVYVLLILGSILVNFYLAKYLSISSHAFRRKAVFFTGIAFNLLLLVFFKYA
ncbi:MAG: MBOAT family protein, partial [Pseudomonadota bacterium]|nr:MBOAT family protein [Pseudomonadota bacterium]